MYLSLDKYRKLGQDAALAAQQGHWHNAKLFSDEAHSRINGELMRDQDAAREAYDEGYRSISG